MGQKETSAAFLTAVEQSFLSDDEKEALRRGADRGVDQELWGKFNDLLIAAIVRSQGERRNYVNGLDAEISRFTAEYEKEKAILDRQFRSELKRTGGGAARQKMWTAYERKIRVLQTRMLRQVKETSTTVLHDVILATVPIRQE